jgi:hypothetical protein
MDAFAQALVGTPVNEFVSGTSWLWPLMEIFHFFGLSLLLGSLLIIDLRLAGFFRQINILATHRLLPWTFIGFGINLTTGILFYLGDPLRYTANIGFRIKMILVLVAGLNALWYFFRIDKYLTNWDPHGDTSPLAKTIAFISLFTWAGVLLLGRLIPYVGTG